MLSESASPTLSAISLGGPPRPRPLWDLCSPEATFQLVLDLWILQEISFCLWV